MFMMIDTNGLLFQIICFQAELSKGQLASSELSNFSCSTTEEKDTHLQQVCEVSLLQSWYVIVLVQIQQAVELLVVFIKTGENVLCITFLFSFYILCCN